MNKENLGTIHHKIVRLAWGILFFTLPITSFPFFPSNLGGRTLVRPLSIYPLVFLVFLITIPRLIRKPLPRTFLPLLAFMVVATISSVFSFSSDLEIFRGVTLFSRFIRSMVTLIIGLAFYFTISLLPENWEDLKFSLRWLYAGFAFALLWGTLQIPYVIHYSPTYFKLANLFQSLVSSRKLFNTRISGMTYEPKWFAEQICFVLIPWLMGSVLTRRSIFPWHYRWITVEWLFMGWAAVILTFTFSRTGLIILGALCVLGYLLFRSYTQRDSLEKERLKRKNVWKILEAILIIAGVVAAFYLIGSQNTYFSRFWRYWTEKKSERERTYLEYIAFQQRFLYWETAMNIYNLNPLLGVGLGNYAFYFSEMLPNRPYDLQKEVIRQITPEQGRDRLITPKNLIARLIAETGLIGTATFVTYILAIIGCVLLLWFSRESEQKYWGMCGLLGIFVFSFVVFSFDSFAMPNMWIVFGLITSAAHIPESFPASDATEMSTQNIGKLNAN